MNMKQLFLAASVACLACTAPGRAMADVKAGVDAWEQGKYDAAVKQWRPAAAAGDADAQFNLGQAYKLGRGVPMDIKAATEWFRKAAAQGHIRAEDNYALLLFREGKRAEAMPLIEKSAARGEPRAQYILGTALFNGENIGKDWKRAYATMTRANNAGLPQAAKSLSLMNQYIPLKDRQEAIKLAAQLERQERSNMLAATQMPPAVTPAAPAQTGKPVPIKPVDLPPSAIVQATPVKQAPAPQANTTKPETGKTATTAPAKTSPPEGKWRVQLGAFSDQSNAKSLWDKLSKRVTGLDAYQHYLVKEKGLTRLLAGPLPTQAAASKLCAAVKAASAGCLVKRP